MNERFEQMMLEATKDMPQGYYVPGEYFQKFAELIVRECVDKIISKGTDWVDFAPSQTGVRPEYWDMAQQIKQHFGVEL